MISPIVYTFIPCLLIFLEPDTGVMLIYLIILYGMLLSSKKHQKYAIIMSVLLVILVLGLGSLYILKQDFFTKIFGTNFFYRIDRLLSFKNGTSFQLNSALIGVGASGIKGIGLFENKIYIPESTTDFIYDLTICNFGIIGGIFVLIIYSAILINLYKNYLTEKRKSLKFITIAIFCALFFQIYEHIFMNIGLMPITGITLPFLSYGGSSMISYFMLFGLIISKNNY